MNCERAREVLWPPEGPRLCDDDVAEARAHVDVCAKCRSYYAADQALLDAYAAARRTSAPIKVREAVFDALAMARAGLAPERPGRAIGRRAAMVASVAVAGALSLLVFGSSDRPASAENDPGIFAEDYLRRAVGQDHIVTSDPSEVRAFLRRELGMGLGPLQSASLALERAEICLIRGQRGALIVYKKEGASISHYLVPRHDARSRAPVVAEYRDSPTGGRMPVVIWSTPSLDQALIGDLAPDELLEIANRGMT